MKLTATTSVKAPEAIISKSDLDSMIGSTVRTLVRATDVKSAKVALQTSAAEILAIPNRDFDPAVREQAHDLAYTLGDAASDLKKIDHELFATLFDAAKMSNSQVVGGEAGALRQLADWIVDNAQAPGREAALIRYTLNEGRSAPLGMFTDRADVVLNRADRSLGMQVANKLPRADLKTVDQNSQFADDISILFALFYVDPGEPAQFHMDWDRHAKDAVHRELDPYRRFGDASDMKLYEQAKTRAEALCKFVRNEYRERQKGPGEREFMFEFQQVVDAKMNSLRPGHHDKFW